MCERFTPQQKLECHAGMGCCIYKKPELKGYADKGNHKESSLFHQPQHAEHFKKEEKRERWGKG